MDVLYAIHDCGLGISPDPSFSGVKNRECMQEALVQAQQTAVAQQMAHLESYSATSEQLFGTAANPHPVTGAHPGDAPEAAAPGTRPPCMQVSS